MSAAMEREIVALRRNLDRCRAERDRLSAKLQAQIEYTRIEYCGCGSLDWTIEKWGRLTHKHACLDRHDAWCQTHPDGCALGMTQ